jgi:hypothetical protein
MPNMHEVDYQILGDDMQFVKIELDPGEAAIGEAGAMMYMEDGIEVQTVFGDGAQQQGGILNTLLGAGKRLLVGESLFMTVFHNRGNGKKKVAFAAPYPGKIIPIHLAEIGGELLAQKDSFLVAAKGVSIGIAFTKRFGAGLFGGARSRPARCCAWTPAASWRCSLRSSTTSSSWAASRPQCSAARVCSTPCCAAPAACGSSRCRSAGSRAASTQPRRRPEWAGARRVRCSAASAA